MTEDEYQDALDWLEGAAEPAAGVPTAAHILALLNTYESRENTVLGMCMVRRPHDEIRDHLCHEVWLEEGDRRG